MEWKWTKGDSYERSPRIMKKMEKDGMDQYGNQQDTCVINSNLENSAYSSSLHYDENTWNILNETVALNGFKNSNKREDMDTKMSSREMIQQIGFNPFLSNSDYANDITISDQFLKPISTSLDRINDKNKE